MNIEQVAHDAQTLLQGFEGDEYIPELLVEFEDGALDILVLVHFPGTATTPTQVKQRYFERLGRQCARKHPGQRLAELCFVCESWGVKQQVRERRTFRFVAEAPGAREYLSLWHYCVASGRQTAIRYEITQRRPVVVYGPEERDEATDTRIKHALWPAFLSGYSNGTPLKARE